MVAGDKNDVMKLHSGDLLGRGVILPPCIRGIFYKSSLFISLSLHQTHKINRKHSISDPTSLPSSSVDSFPDPRMSVNQSEAFLQAAEDSKKLTQKPSNDELLELYGSLSPSTHTLLASLTMM